jgi:hypothetical protein
MDHVELVVFPSQRRFSNTEVARSDVEIVNCVREQIGFRFAAYFAESADNLSIRDRGPFETLYNESEQD